MAQQPNPAVVLPPNIQQDAPATNVGPQQAANAGPQQAANAGPQQAAIAGPQQAANAGPQRAANAGPQLAANAETQQRAARNAPENILEAQEPTVGEVYLSFPFVQQ